jgi:hypothetical protein
VVVTEPGHTGGGADELGAVCRCGHSHDAHQHFRRGADCALCRCRRYREPVRARLTRLVDFLVAE